MTDHTYVNETHCAQCIADAVVLKWLREQMAIMLDEEIGKAGVILGIHGEPSRVVTPASTGYAETEVGEEEAQTDFLGRKSRQIPEKTRAIPHDLESFGFGRAILRHDVPGVPGQNLG